MRDSATAVSFLANLFRPAFARLAPRPAHFLRANGERIDVDIYEPRSERFGTVAMIHGMNSRGHRDPRVLVASQALASVGLRVFAPRLPEVGQAVITMRSVERISDVLHFAATESREPVSVFAPSFSAAMSLIASTREYAGDAVASVFAMGTYSDPETVIRFLLEDPHAHPYGRLIVLKNFLHRAVGPIPEIEAVLNDVIVALGLRRIEEGHYPQLARLPADQRQLVERLLTDHDFRVAHAERMAGNDYDHLLERLSVSRRASAIKGPVTLFHGEGDDVIPPQESIQLAQLLERQGVDVHLDVSPLISHGDRQSFWRERSALM
ncbi:MAG: prolyl oligopeptidase family serine peptidase, partial [Myxococcota bacterium]